LNETATRELAEDIIEAIQEKKASDIVLLDLREISDITDYFLISSVASNVQARVVADVIVEKLKSRGQPFYVEGYDSPHWILVDSFSMVFHIFQPDVREFYALEKFWGDAPREEFPDE
jgi:ribosome-associated protein